MPTVTDLPCCLGICMKCKKRVPQSETLTCITCDVQWHTICLTTTSQTPADAAQWNCPDCAEMPDAALVETSPAMESDESITDPEKEKSVMEEKFNCSICMQTLDMPVTTPCAHNFCLKCFQVMTRKRTCPICRRNIPLKMSREPRINCAIVKAIRMAKHAQSNSSKGAPIGNHFVHDQDRPDKAFTTDRAKRSGMANAKSGRIFVTVPLDHFGPIPAENDPIRNQGVLVGETWANRMEAKQWGAHFQHVGGINGQSAYGAQSVALSGGYEDDEDHGDWFLYTGSGGRVLAGNKRTNKKQSFAQIFTRSNEALRVSCLEGYPVRVVRSHKEKRSYYAPQNGIRYDGIYRVEKCWRKPGIQGLLVCRYLLIRCDNEPAPWTSENHGDRPRPLPFVEELHNATEISEREGSPAWDYDEEQGRWIWKKPPPKSQKEAIVNKIGKLRKRQRTKSV